MFPSQGSGVDAKKFDPYANQWMREAMESRHVIEELKAHNDKLQRDVYALNSKVSLIYECCADLGITDRVGDLIQKKLHGFQAAQVARQLQGQGLAMVSPRTKKPSILDPKPDEGFICGSSAFQELAGFSSSYEGQVSRDTFHRKNMFEAEEARFRDQFDIFGNPKMPSPKSQQDPGATIARSGDMIDKLLLGSEGKAAAEIDSCASGFSQ
ncbi:hypothetical protein PybrP1_002603 [[Pythium] brassicae (nom. inval.)]|nr:hypothetical protein PybrP1_002603 [[Pythium] brassicae (nom. inval.)]